MHGFWIMDDTSVVVETIDSEITADIALYQRVMDELWTVAVEGDDARAMVARLATETAASR
jgi:hypothetical protein